MPARSMVPVGLAWVAAVMICSRGGLLNWPSVLGVGGDLPAVHGESLGGVRDTWLRQGGGYCGDLSVVDRQLRVGVDAAGEDLRFSDGGECSFHVGPDCLRVSLTGDIDVDGAALDGPGHRNDEIA